MSRILIAGCGYVGSALGVALDGGSHNVWGLRRRATSLPWGVRPVEADLGVPSSLTDLPARLDTVFYMAAPGGRDEALYRATYVEGLRNLLEALAAQKQSPARILFVSSTSVYGERNGEWVDESTPEHPEGLAGRLLLEAERTLRESPFPGVVVRFGGIYGPRRAGLVDRVRAAQAEIPPTPVYTNRIHRDDCVGALLHLMSLPDPEQVYLGVDDEPADLASVYHWLAGVLGAAEPRVGADAPRSRGSKRCRNDRLVASGYAFRYPSFREGYAAILAEQE